MQGKRTGITVICSGEEPKVGKWRDLGDLGRKKKGKIEGKGIKMVDFR